MDARKTADNTSPQALAEACAKAMWAEDRASQALGMEIQRMAPGEAVMSMQVREDMTNGHGMCHGGFIFTLAEAAFAFPRRTRATATSAHPCAAPCIEPA